MDTDQKTTEEPTKKIIRITIRLCGAKRDERSPNRADSRAGRCYEQGLDTQPGNVKLKVPSLCAIPFSSPGSSSAVVSPGKFD
jgi:transposase-like protein